MDRMFVWRAMLAILPAVGLSTSAVAVPLDGGLLRFGWTMPDDSRASRQVFGPSPWTSTPADRTTPILDELMPEDRSDAGVRRRRATATLGHVDLSFEGMRQSASGIVGVTPREKRLSLGVGTGWSSGSDHFMLGAAVERRAYAQPDLLAARAPLHDNVLAMGVSWIHDGWMRLDIGWQREGAGRVFDGPTRMVDIASGAPLHEAGMRLALGFQPRGSSLRFGIEARDVRVARDDLFWLGTSNRQDARLGLFARARF